MSGQEGRRSSVLSEPSNVNLEYLTIDPRAYKFIREQSMQDIADAFVELITNCIDAYRQTDNDQYKVEIRVYPETRYIKVIDAAIGLSADKMRDAFLQVGGYTAAVGSRGYFSRGAKDISALGDLAITAFKDGKMSQCFINTLGQGGFVFQDVDITEEDRAEYLIAENGLNFSVKLKETVDLDITRIGAIVYHYALRDIYSDPDNLIFINLVAGLGSHNTKEDVILTRNRLFYEYPPAQKIINITYNVPGYDVPATFTLYKTESPIQSQYDDTNDKYLNFGILVGTTEAVHTNTVLYPQIRYHPYISHLYGRIQCDHITVLMKELDLPPNEYDVLKNPFSIIDPNRVGGLNRTHPFIQALYKIPYERMLFVLEQMENESNEGHELNFSDINDLFTRLDLNSDLLNFDVVESNKQQFIDALYNNINKAQGGVETEEQNLPYSKHNIDIIYSENVEKYRIKPQLRIKFTNKDLKYDYLTYKNKDGYTIEISVPNSLLKHYVVFDEQGNPHGLEKREAQVHLNYLLKEAISRILVTKHFEKISLTSKEELFVNADIIFNRFEHYSNKIEDQLNNIILGSTKLTDI